MFTVVKNPELEATSMASASLTPSSVSSPTFKLHGQVSRNTLRMISGRCAHSAFGALVDVESHQWNKV